MERTAEKIGGSERDRHPLNSILKHLVEKIKPRNFFFTFFLLVVKIRTKKRKLA